MARRGVCVLMRERDRDIDILKHAQVVPGNSRLEFEYKRAGVDVTDIAIEDSGTVVI